MVAAAQHVLRRRPFGGENGRRGDGDGNLPCPLRRSPLRCPARRLLPRWRSAGRGPRPYASPPSRHRVAPGSRPGSKVWNGLYYTTREYPFKKCHLCDLDYTVDFSTFTSREDCVSVIATTPLTDDEEWTELKRGELVVRRHTAKNSSSSPCAS